jgi:SAM-dependent methyltransferase
MADGSVYGSTRLARLYAYSRPPVHPRVVALVAQHLHASGWPPPGVTSARAIDIGCGAGLSTAALAPLADWSVGIEPMLPMLAHREHAAPNARFLAARAEQLPFADGTFHLMTAAGALNYADPDRFLPEAARVLSAQGVLVVYDFSSGRRLRGDERLDRWFASFEERYPFPPGYAMDVRAIPFPNVGLRLREYRDFEVHVPMTLESYLDYAMSETNVEAAIARGTPEAEVAGWCRSSLEPFFPRPDADVGFTGYFASIGRG